jgi:hypothetical protein
VDRSFFKEPLIEFEQLCLFDAMQPFILTQSCVQIDASTVVDDSELLYGSNALPPVLKANSETIVETNQHCQRNNWHTN